MSFWPIVMRLGCRVQGSGFRDWICGGRVVTMVYISRSCDDECFNCWGLHAYTLVRFTWSPRGSTWAHLNFARATSKLVPYQTPRHHQQDQKKAAPLLLAFRQQISLRNTPQPPISSAKEISLKPKPHMNYSLNS